MFLCLGSGVFDTKEIEKGTYVCEYRGEKISAEETFCTRRTMLPLLLYCKKKSPMVITFIYIFPC